MPGDIAKHGCDYRRPIAAAALATYAALAAASVAASSDPASSKPPTRATPNEPASAYRTTSVSGGTLTVDASTTEPTTAPAYSTSAQSSRGCIKVAELGTGLGAGLRAVLGPLPGLAHLVSG